MHHENDSIQRRLGSCKQCTWVQIMSLEEVEMPRRYLVSRPVFCSTYDFLVSEFKYVTLQVADSVLHTFSWFFWTI